MEKIETFRASKIFFSTNNNFCVKPKIICDYLKVCTTCD